MPEGSAHGPWHAAALRHAIHVWYADTGAQSYGALAVRYFDLLDESERTRAARLHFEHDRRDFLAAHALRRLCLAHYLGCEPPSLRFTATGNGKPQLADVPAQLPLEFNLSHTRGLVACAVTLGRACGVDVERVRPMHDMAGVARTVFSDAERTFLAAAGEKTRESAFFALWTLKEAYVKATGLGMTAPLQRIAIDPVELCVRDDSRVPTAEGGWIFDRWHRCSDTAAGHSLALACERNDRAGAPLTAVAWGQLDLDSGCMQVSGDIRHVMLR